MMRDHTLLKEIQVDLVVVMVVVHKPKVVQMQEVPLKEILVVLEVLTQVQVVAVPVA